MVQGDKLYIPIYLYNNMGKDISVRLSGKSSEGLISAVTTPGLFVKARSTATVVLSLTASSTIDLANVTIEGQAT